MEEETRKREHGFPNTLEVSAVSKKAGDPGFVAEGTVLFDVPGGNHDSSRSSEWIAREEL